MGLELRCDLLGKILPPAEHAELHPSGSRTPSGRERKLGRSGDGLSEFPIFAKGDANRSFWEEAILHCSLSFHPFQPVLAAADRPAVGALRLPLSVLFTPSGGFSEALEELSHTEPRLSWGEAQWS